MRTSAPIKVKMYLPQTDEGRQALSMRVAEAHADIVMGELKRLSCSNEQKRALIRSITSQIAELNP